MRSISRPISVGVPSLPEVDQTEAQLSLWVPREISLKNMTSSSEADETGDFPFGFVAMD
ncbi:hypothetical protein DY000_02018620 [Brassica cretica]|uniref:Uncharacterized protein n=1 Tax=Brassica cretica TaxID=69181 RepID=A0ABQ7DCM9_BRACR|nr:hypothetical protein DY000_02018620 [Brassica cretica]